jgi:hypothetical protein
VRVRVVDPCGLPSGYALPVRTSDGRTFDVRVSDGGIWAGQTFESVKIAPEPVTGRFSSELCDCGGEGWWLGQAILCVGVAFTALMEKLQLDACGGRECPKKESFWIFSLVWVASYSCFLIEFITDSRTGPATQLDQSQPGVYRLLISLIHMVWLLLVVAKARARMALRLHYRIPRSFFADLLPSSLHGCCSALQMSRGLDASGERPMRFESLIGAEIV